MWIDIRPSGTNPACSVVFCHLKTTKQRSYSDACPPLAGPHKIHWSIQSTAPNFFGNAFFIIVLYRETKTLFKKLGTRK